MMMKDDKRKMATIIVSKMKKGDESSSLAPESAGAEVADADEMYMVADDVMEAIKNGDVRALKESLQSMIEVMMSRDSESEMESED
jgi:hypothetical protein